MLPKIIDLIKSRQSEIILAFSIILIAIIAFESGRISTIHQVNQPLEITYPPAMTTNSNFQSSIPAIKKNINPSSQKLDLRVIASKNSTLYHFLWCSGAKKIKEENKITFASEQEAQKRGYKLASNCQK